MRFRLPLLVLLVSVGLAACSGDVVDTASPDTGLAAETVPDTPDGESAVVTTPSTDSSSTDSMDSGDDSMSQDSEATASTVSSTDTTGMPVAPIPDLPVGELEQARLVIEAETGPYAYVTLSPICDGCSGEISMYMVPSPDDPLRKVAKTHWVNGNEVAGGSTELWAISPEEVPGTLVAAMEDGSAVEWTIDPITGSITSWTIDGVGARYSCYQVDTAPIEQRDKDCYGAFPIG